MRYMTYILRTMRDRIEARHGNDQVDKQYPVDLESLAGVPQPGAQSHLSLVLV